ncbi:hypothetical protein NUW54_g6645 [Trametes sanguinea]|uniref:Uncharacterized protein n=1 Tax=Trametes sanguinea TaxID=158606 RepID=A0ACC1PV06_9APHY|nr:hypothetical protein NUW54_g6645 [Trametes sanguinea]
MQRPSRAQEPPSAESTSSRLKVGNLFSDDPPAIKASTVDLASPFFLLTFAYRPRTSCAAQALLHSVMGVGLLGLVGKLHKWDDSAMFFDGSSLGTCFLSLPPPPSASPLPSRAQSTPHRPIQSFAHTSASAACCTASIAFV